MLFRPWALMTPFTADNTFNQDVEDRAHKLFCDGAIRYPFEDSLFWDEGEEDI